MIRKFLFLTTLLAGLTAAAQPVPGSRSYDCFRTTGKIKVDGRLNEADWQAAAPSEAFADIRGVDFQPAPLKEHRGHHRRGRRDRLPERARRHHLQGQ